MSETTRQPQPQIRRPLDVFLLLTTALVAPTGAGGTPTVPIVQPEQPPAPRPSPSPRRGQ